MQLRTQFQNDLYRRELRNYFAELKINPDYADGLYYGFCNMTLVAKLAKIWYDNNSSRILENKNDKELRWITEVRFTAVHALSGIAIDQNTLTGNLLKISKRYLPKQLPIFEKLYKGACCGFSILVSCAILMPSHDKEKNSNTPHDNWEYLKKLFQRISLYYDYKQLSPAEISEFERLGNLLEFFQSSYRYLPISQGDADGTTKFVLNQGFEKTYSIASLFTAQENDVVILNEVLQKTDATTESASQFIITSSHNHDTAIIQKDNTLYFYCPNSRTGIIRLHDREALNFLIFLANKFKPELASPIGYRVFSRTGQRNFSEQQTLLEKTYAFQQQQFQPAEKNYCGNYTAIDAAAFIGCTKSIISLLARGAPLTINRTQSRPETIMHFLKTQPQFDQRDIYGHHFIHTAIWHDNHELVEKLLHSDKSKANAKTRIGMPALHFSIQLHRVNIARTLLDAGADANTRYYGKSALHMALDLKNREMLKMLHQKGVTSLVVGCNGNTELFLAVLLNRKDHVKLLMEIGDDVLRKNEIDYYPIQFVDTKNDFLYQFLAYHMVLAAYARKNSLLAEQLHEKYIMSPRMNARANSVGKFVSPLVTLKAVNIQKSEESKMNRFGNGR